MQKIEPVKNLILKELHGHFRNSYVLKVFVIRTREELERERWPLRVRTSLSDVIMGMTANPGLIHSPAYLQTCF